MRKLKVFMIVGFCSFLCFHLASFSDKIEKFAIVEIIIEDKALIEDSFVEFEICKNGINSSYFNDNQYIRFDIKRKRTLLRIPLTESINYARISFVNNGRDGIESPVNLHYDNNLFIFQDKDTVGIHIYSKEFGDIKFSGKSAAKFSSMYEIQNLPAISEKDNTIFNELLGERRIDDAIKYQRRSSDYLYEEAISIMDRNRNYIDETVMKLINIDVRAYYNKVFIKSLGMISRQINGEGFKEKIYEALKNDSFSSTEITLDSSLYSLSFNHCDVLLEYERFLNTFLINDEMSSFNNRFDFERFYKGIMRKYEGPKREKLILLTIISNINKEDEVRNYIQLATKFVSIPSYRNALENVSFDKIFPFELIDGKGDFHKISDLKDKVIILDFWFTGCLSCKFLAEEMEPIIESYKSDNDVQFVSISVDKNKELWLSSLKSSEYSSKQALNLWIGDLSINHPMIKYHHIQSYPKLMVIGKNGEIITQAPPRPIKTDPNSSIKFKQLIDLQL